MSKITEEAFENEIVLPIFRELGYPVLYGPEIVPDGINPERENYEQVILTERLRASLKRINPDLSNDIIQESIGQLLRTESPDLLLNNHTFHKKLTEGVKVETMAEREVAHKTVRLVDETNVENNDWLVVRVKPHSTP
jgi:type I restriction enzyme R subunit